VGQQKNPTEVVQRIADAVRDGKISQSEGARRLGIAQASLSAWMLKRGYPKMQFCSTSKQIEPTERDINALQQYWRRDCNMQDLIEYTGRSYPVVKRWIDKGIGKE
jgi:hypothetical protein